jgi:Holliday junction resolvasome RuvABC ATP-dependent DNA helicase subunit
MKEVLPLSESLIDEGSVNILLQGPAGCGKTKLAGILAERITESWAFQIPVKGDINWPKMDDFRVHIIDEIHMFKRFELLYPLMDSGEHIFIFCTTEYGETPDPFLTRCIRFSFEPYSLESLTLIVRKYAQSRKFTFPTDGCYSLIAEASRGTPRLAKQRFDRVKLLLEHYGYPKREGYVNSILNQIGIFKGGYTKEDFRYMEYLHRVGHSSLDNIARVLQIDKNTIAKEIEPYLFERGHIELSSRGRQFKHHLTPNPLVRGIG